MDEAVNLGIKEVLAHFQCAICLENSEEIKICPHCSWIFCNKCIRKWLANKGTCPRCLNALQYPALVKGCLISQIQESIKKLLSTMDNKDDFCDKHATKQLSLFCYTCKVTICVHCLYLEKHSEHKERVVLLEEAFEHYKRSLKVGLTWIGERKVVVERIQSELSDEHKEIERLCQSSVELLDCNASPTTMRQTLETDRDIAKLWLNHHEDTNAIRMERGREFMSEPTVLVFQMPIMLDKIMKGHESYEANLQAPYGFEWKCKIANEAGTLLFYLSLIAGRASDYSVQVDNVLEKIDRYELDHYVKVGAYQPVVNGEKQELTLRIRQSYADKIQQQQDYIDRLEKKNAKYEELEASLADVEKKSELQGSGIGSKHFDPNPDSYPDSDSDSNPELNISTPTSIPTQTLTPTTTMATTPTLTVTINERRLRNYEYDYLHQAQYNYGGFQYQRQRRHLYE